MDLLVRRFIAIQVLLTLAPAVFSAPFQHLHGHEDTDHFVKAHRAQALVTHTHLSTGACRGGHSGTVVVTASPDDDDSVSVDWFQDNPHPAPSLEFALVEILVLPAPEPAACWADVPIHRSHDPPLISSFRPRSPPTSRIFSPRA